MKIGIFGGSFNPPHRMHKEIVCELIKKGYVDKVIVVPTADNYDKPCLLKGEDRVRMLKGIFKNNPKVDVSNFEVKGSLYTINTMNYFQEKYPSAELFFICGTDNLAELDTWNSYKKILQNYKLLVVSRDTNDFEKEAKKYEKYKESIIKAEIKPQVISSSKVRKMILKYGFNEELKKYLYINTINYLKNIDFKQYWS